MKIIKEVPITNAEARELLEKKESERELNYFQKNALSVLRKFVSVETEKIKKIVEELRNLGVLREKQIIAIANFLPEDRDDLRVVLQKEYNSLTDEEIEKILEIIKRNI